MVSAVQTCQHDTRTKHGKDRHGRQRWKCSDCGVTLTSDEQRPLGDMRTDLDDAARVIAMLLEGMSLRACSRITGMKVDTICDLVLLVGQNCDAFLEKTVKGVAADFIEMDELWGFVGCKQKTAVAKGLGLEFGDSWSWFAIDADTKLILSHAVGQRDESTCLKFLRRLNGATVGKTQVTSDGLAVALRFPATDERLRGKRVARVCGSGGAVPTFRAWVAQLNSRQRAMLDALAVGDRIGELAVRFGCTSSNVSQFRRRLAESWEAFTA